MTASVQLFSNTHTLFPCSHSAVGVFSIFFLLVIYALHTAYIFYDFYGPSFQYLCYLNATLIVMQNRKKDKITKSAMKKLDLHLVHTNEIVCLCLFACEWKRSNNKKKLNLNGIHHNTIYTIFFAPFSNWSSEPTRKCLKYCGILVGT